MNATYSLLLVVLFLLTIVHTCISDNDVEIIPAAPVESQCFHITPNDVKALFNQYNQALATCDPVRVVALFWDR